MGIYFKDSDDNKCMFKERYWAKLEFQESLVDGGLIKKPMWEDMYSLNYWGKFVSRVPREGTEWKDLMTYMYKYY